MDEQKQKTEQPAEADKSALIRWQRFLGVAYRLVIITGLLSFALGFVLVIFTDMIPFLFMAFPLVVIIIGLILARYEYALHKQQTQDE